MIKKCIGCGVVLQCEYSYEDGYVNPAVFDKTVMCKRCFRLKNYGEYKVNNKSTVFYKGIIKSVFKMHELVVHVIDIMDIGNLDYIYSNIFCPSILVISKKDILPKSVNEEEIISYFKNKYPRYKEIIMVSSKNNYHFDELFELIMQYKTSNEVYVLGNTNAGKSSLINKMIKNYTEGSNYIVTSYTPNTTLNVISIKISDDLILLDTPGIINEGNITNYLTVEQLKIVDTSDEIRPKVFQIPDKASILLGDIGRIDVLDESNISIYISNDVDVNRVNYDKNIQFKNFTSKEFLVNKDDDLVIEGLCFIKCSDKTLFNVYVPNGVEVYIREKFIG